MVILQRFTNILLRPNNIYNLKKNADLLMLVQFCKYISSKIHILKDNHRNNKHFGIFYHQKQAKSRTYYDFDTFVHQEKHEIRRLFSILSIKRWTF